MSRINDCAAELHSLINEECLFGVTLLIMANKTDLDNVLKADQISEVKFPKASIFT